MVNKTVKKENGQNGQTPPLSEAQLTALTSQPVEFVMLEARVPCP